MYICNECGATFETPVRGYEEEKDSCPKCRSWGFTEAVRCHGCGEWDSEKLCRNCKKNFKDAVRGFVDMYCKELNMRVDEVQDLIEDSLSYGYTVTVKAERIE